MNDQVIWDFLMDKIGNPYGVAGLMGNLYVESKLDPGLLQSSYARKLGMTKEEYAKAVNEGTYTNFVHDGAGYGLVQWTYWSRKQGLLDYVKSKGVSIDDLQAQLEYLWQEIQTYKTVMTILKQTNSVSQASNIVTERYEKPADQSYEGKLRRAQYGEKYYQLYAKPLSKRVYVNTDKVNIRQGNSKSYARLRVAARGDKYRWVATAENGWFAIDLGDKVGWISGEFSNIE